MKSYQSQTSKQLDLIEEKIYMEKLTKVLPAKRGNIVHFGSF